MTIHTLTRFLRSGRQVAWLSLTHEDAARARRILDADFWNSDWPFRQDDYRQIGYPFGVGLATKASRRHILQSAAFRDAACKQFKRDNIAVVENGELCPPDELQFLLPIICQMLIADYFLYRQHNIRMSVYADIAQLQKDTIHRSTRGISLFDEPRHADFGLNKYQSVKTMAEAFRRGGTYSDLVVSKQAKGVARMYSMASAFATEFTRGRPFQDWELIHYISEDHGSPRVPVATPRAFVLGVIHPV